MVARIYKPAKTAMQSGSAKTRWCLEYEPASARQTEPLMGWTSSSDMNSQIKLYFDTEAEAIAYAERNGIAFERFEPKARKTRVVSYSDNFKYGRIGTWTH